MNKIKIGLIREGKFPIDRRVPLTPLQAKEVEQKYPNTKVVVQTSSVRVFCDKDYENEGIQILDDISDCDILMGIKEVPIADLVPEKIYLFFSHTIKKQTYNRKLLQKILEKKIQLIDYEALKDKKGKRLAAFGRYAGIVGSYNGLIAYGKRYNLYTMRKATDCFDLTDLKTELSKVKLPPVKILLTGSGRVAQGVMEILDGIAIRKVRVENFLENTYNEPVYVQLRNKNYHIHKDNKPFDRDKFYQSPQNYVSTFNNYTKMTDLLIAGSYWNPQAPVLFTREDMIASDFGIKVIADITCDIEGSIPSTKRPTTIDEPVYDYDPTRDQICTPFSSPHYVTVMAVDNLPCELPRSASEGFGKELIDKIIPSLVATDKNDIIKRATVSLKGKLTKNFAYLKDYVSAKISNEE